MTRWGGFLGDPDILEGSVVASEDQLDIDGGPNRRGRAAFAAILALLLLLCSVATIVETWVSYGPDEIRVITENIECLQCHSELIPSFAMNTVHLPFEQKGCTTCHTPHGEIKKTTVLSGAKLTWERTKTLVEWLPLKLVVDVFYSAEGKTAEEAGGDVKSVTEEQIKGADSEFTAPKDEICWICHGDMGEMLGYEYQHAPFEGGFCTNCHSPHASDNRFLLKYAEKDLCITCHRMGPELSREQVHPPVEGRFCTNCHDPHASRYSGILVDNQRDLCFTCHPSVAPLSLKPVQHNPFLYDNCTGCHEPHGSDYRPLLIKKQPDVCYLCHGDIKNDFLKPSHHPVGTIQLNCADCHDPHGADYPGLLAARDNEMCYQCHAKAIQTTYDDSAHFDTLCIECHTPHGSDYAPILVDENPDVCLRCHTAYDENNGHPVRPTYYDVNAKAPLTCTTSCHNPHGTSNGAMLIHYPQGWDGNCLICHGVVPGERVGIDF